MTTSVQSDRDALPDQSTVAAMLADLDHPLWVQDEPPMPAWLQQLRPHQIVAIMRIIEAYRHTDVVILDAPVGSGKSIVAELVRRILNAKGLYVCTTKTLQDQLNKDFEHSHLLKGRANYPTQHGPFPDVTAADCTFEPTSPDCMWCDERSMCNYNLAKQAAHASRLAIINTAYFLTECNGPGQFGVKNPRGLVVIDEADELEQSLMNHVEVVVSNWWIKKLGVGLPERKTARAKSNDWVEWAESVAAALSKHLAGLPRSTSVKQMRHRKRTGYLLDKVNRLIRELPEGGWIYDGYDRDRPTAIFKPVMVDKFGQDMVFRHGRRFLLMSGSVLSAGHMAECLGVEDYEGVTVHVNWDAERRPVYVSPVANVTWKNQDSAYPVVASTVREIVEAHPGERVLVHGVSYALCNAIMGGLGNMNGRPILTYRNAGEREEVLQEYLATPGAVIVAPSLDRGVDFKDDLARVQVIAKVPYPSRGDKQIRTRMHMGRGGRLWYQVQTVRSFVQMVGRGMRHEDDTCVTYCLDQQLTKSILPRNKALIPSWLKDAMVLGRATPWHDERTEIHRSEIEGNRT